MAEEKAWAPREIDPVTEVRKIYLDPRTGIIRLRNMSNLIFGTLGAWIAFFVAAAFFNRSALSGSDPSPPLEVGLEIAGLFLSSVGGLVILARTRLDIRQGVALIRNPVRIYEFDMRRIDGLSNGFWGFPTVEADGRRIRVLGVQESVAQRMRGGSDVRAALEAVIEICTRSPEEERSRLFSVADEPYIEKPLEGAAVSERMAIWDPWLIVLLIAWAGFFSTFLV